MILLVLLALGSVVTSQEQTPECFASISALAAQPSCQWAVGNITDRTASSDQFELACNDSMECKSIYRNYARDCFSTIIPGDIVQLVCAMPSANDTCAHVLLEDITFDYIFDTYFPQVGIRCINSYLTGKNCNTECMEIQRSVYERFGCCWTEVLAYFPTIMEFGINVSEDTAATLIGLFDWCGISVSFCDNRPLPAQSDCDSTIMGLYNGSDCSAEIADFIASNFQESFFDITAIQGCPSLVIQLAEACGALNPTLGFFGNLFSTLGRARNLNGISCIQYIDDMLNYYYSVIESDQNVCVYDFARGRCSDGCRQTLNGIKDQYGCCFNEFFRVIASSNNDSRLQINYALLTGELYTFCDVTSPGFCEHPNAGYSTDALKCINAANQVFESDDLCSESFTRIMEATSLGSVSSAAQDICVIQQCRDRIISFVQYLSVCDGLDDNDVIQQDFEYLAGLAKSTTCKTNGTVSCLAITQQNPTAFAVASAFTLDEGSGICLSNFDPTKRICSSECRQLLQAGAGEMGCCFSEFGVAFLDEGGYNIILSQCELVGQRCNEIEVNSNDPCVMAQMALRNDTNCADALTAIMDTTTRVTSRAVLNQTNNYLKTLCSNPGCANIVSNYFNTCQSLISNDPLLDMIRINYDAFACQQSDVNAIDCYALRLSEPTIAAAIFAFQRTGSCESSLQNDTICSAACRSIINRALEYSGCCLTDILKNSLKNNGITTVKIEEVYARCQITGPSSCVQDVKTSGQANVEGFNIFLILLFCMMLQLFA